MKDFFGREITPGMQVVYPTMMGDSITLRHGEVKKINPSSILVQPVKAKWSYGRDTTVRAVSIQKTENVIIVPADLRSDA